MCNFSSESLSAQARKAEASLIEQNVELVDRALAMLNAMLASQVDWTEIWREVKRQQRMGHPIAEHIHSLNLEQNEFKILLAVTEDEEGTDDTPMQVVSLDLNLSAHANVARLHSRRKETREKTSRTQTHAEAAIKTAERKAHQDMQKFDLKQTIRRVRQNWWFEKFIWFISSEFLGLTSAWKFFCFPLFYYYYCLFWDSAPAKELPGDFRSRRHTN